jgi:uncharacterized protein (TIGR02598 family)
MNPRIPGTNWESRKRSGFSLVEVTIAIGIVAFGVIAIMGVLPVAMVTIRDAMDRNTEANLVREFTGEALRTPFSKLANWVGASPYYFDEQGKGSDAVNAHFKVSLTATAPSLPGGRSAGSSQPEPTASSRVVQIRIERLHSAPGNAKIHALHVANSGY